MLKRNWDWRNSRLFCHIFVISEISIGGAGSTVPPQLWLHLCSNWGKQKRCWQIFRKVSGVFQQNFIGSKNRAVLEPRTGQFSRIEASRPRTWKCVLEAKDVFEDSTSVSKCGSFGDRKNLKISNLKIIWKYRTSMFITSQKNFITLEKSIFSMFKRQGNN